MMAFAGTNLPTPPDPRTLDAVMAVLQLIPEAEQSRAFIAELKRGVLEYNEAAERSAAALRDCKAQTEIAHRAIETEREQHAKHLAELNDDHAQGIAVREADLAARLAAVEARERDVTGREAEVAELQADLEHRLSQLRALAA
jgi:hypothetical protein